MIVFLRSREPCTLSFAECTVQLIPSLSYSLYLGGLAVEWKKEGTMNVVRVRVCVGLGREGENEGEIGRGKEGVVDWKWSEGAAESEDQEWRREEVRETLRGRVPSRDPRLGHVLLLLGPTGIFTTTLLPGFVSHPFFGLQASPPSSGQWPALDPKYILTRDEGIYYWTASHLYEVPFSQRYTRSLS
jgi:hypothetical protein